MLPADGCKRRFAIGRANRKQSLRFRKPDFVPCGGGIGIGGGIGGGFGGSQGGYKEESGLDYYSYPKYKFEYGVKDYHTGDHKSQWEMRDGDVVKGEYTLDEADGTKRIVEYYADSKTGFEAKVKNIGHAIEGSMGGQEGGIGGGYGHGYSYSKLKKYN